MDDAERFVRDLASFEQRIGRSRSHKRPVLSRASPNWKRQTREALGRIKRLFRRNPDPPGDPYAYVMAPKKPRPPHLSATAMADKPES